MNQQKIGEFLKHLRNDKGLTQEQLAEHFYVSSRTVSRWETGRNMPELDMLIELDCSTEGSDSGIPGNKL